MPRKIDPRFGSGEIVELDHDEMPAPERFERVMGSLTGEFDRQSALKALTEIAEDHWRWAKQAAGDVTSRQCNEQLRRLAAAAQLFAGDPLGSADEIKAMIAGLNGPALQALWKTPSLEHPQHDQPWTVSKMQEDLPAVLGAANEAAPQRSGPKHDLSLTITVDRLAALYENATGQPATHSPNSRGVYKGPPQSAAGQFIRAFFEVVDKDVRGTQLSRALSLAVRSRRIRAARTPGSNYLIGDS